MHYTVLVTANRIGKSDRISNKIHGLSKETLLRRQRMVAKESGKAQRSPVKKVCSSNQIYPLSFFGLTCVCINREDIPTDFSTLCMLRSHLFSASCHQKAVARRDLNRVTQQSIHFRFCAKRMEPYFFCL